MAIQRSASVRARVVLRQWAAETWGRLLRTLLRNAYVNDGLISVHRHAFMDDPQFQRAYQRGVDALGGHDRYQWQWRVHIGLWAAASASQLDGDFIECGVNYGFLSSAVMEFLDWDRLGKTFYLLDTFAGLDPRFITEGERRAGTLKQNEERLCAGIYVSSVDSVRANFAQWRNQRIIVGAIPETLDQVDARAVAFLHIDMNCAPPEVAALRFFWPRLSPGAFVLLDDYAYLGFEEQRLAMNALASELGVPICALPTGQGLLIKPAR
jgi:Macrocin-O-methyltransferase (TylF)